MRFHEVTDEDYGKIFEVGPNFHSIKEEGQQMDFEFRHGTRDHHSSNKRIKNVSASFPR